MSDVVVVIPARYGASRLPGKPLLDLHGEPMIARVWQRACQSDATRVVIATDDERIDRKLSTSKPGQVTKISRQTNPLVEFKLLCTCNQRNQTFSQNCIIRRWFWIGRQNVPELYISRIIPTPV